MGNLALNKTSTASSNIIPFTSGRAVDGSNTAMQRWIGSFVAGSGNAYLIVDLGGPFWIDRWVVKHMAAITGWPSEGWKAPDYCMMDYKFQGSNDNRTWYDLDAVTDNSVAITDRRFIGQKYRYVRVLITKGLRINPQIASIMELEVYEAAPTSSLLSNLVLSSGTLNPGFTKTTLAYSASVAGSVSSITVTPTAEDSRATIKVNGSTVASGSASQPINLVNVSTPVIVEVTPAVGDQKTTYTINVTKGHSASLSNLTLSSGSLNPGFSSGTYSYTAQVDASVNSITVTPTAQDTTSTIKVNNNVVASGQASGPITLNSGNTSINVTVVTVDGSETKAYGITVSKSGSKYLQSLTLAGSSGAAIALSPAFDGKNQFNYTATSDYDDTSVTMTLVKEDPTATLTVSGSSATLSGNVVTLPTSAVGNYPVTITVTSGSSSQAYNVTVTKPSSAYLTGLQIKSGPTVKPLTPNFSRKTFAYTCGGVTSNFTVTAILEDTTGPATMTLTVGSAAPVPLNSGSPSTSISMPSSNTVRIKITVTSKSGGAVKEYIVDVSR